MQRPTFLTLQIPSYITQYKEVIKKYFPISIQYQWILTSTDITQLKKKKFV